MLEAILMKVKGCQVLGYRAAKTMLYMFIDLFKRACGRGLQD